MSNSELRAPVVGQLPSQFFEDVRGALYENVDRNPFLKSADNGYWCQFRVEAKNPRLNPWLEDIFEAVDPMLRMTLDGCRGRVRSIDILAATSCLDSGEAQGHDSVRKYHKDGGRKILIASDVLPAKVKLEDGTVVRGARRDVVDVTGLQHKTVKNKGKKTKQRTLVRIAALKSPVPSITYLD